MFDLEKNIRAWSDCYEVRGILKKLTLLNWKAICTMKLKI